MLARKPLRSLLPPAALVLMLLPFAQLAKAATAPAAAGAPSGADVNRIVLRVNDEIFTLYEYEQRKARRSAGLLNDPSISPAERQKRIGEVGKEVLQQALQDMLLASQARRAAIAVSDREVDESIEQVKQEQGIQTEEEFQQALAQAGLTMELLRANFRKEMVTGRLVQKEVTGKINIDEDEMRAYYRNHPDEFKRPEERKLREVIVLEASGLPEADLQKMAAKIQAELSAPGANAQEIVSGYQDQGYSSSLIDLGWLKKGDLEKSLEEAAWNLESGRFSAPIKARGGYHLVLLEEKKGGDLLPYNEVEKMIQGRERQKRFGKEYRSYLAQLEKGSYIQENPPAEAVGYRSLMGAAGEEDELQVFRAPLQEEPPAKAEEPKAEAPKAEAPPTPPGSGGGR